MTVYGELSRLETTAHERNRDRFRPTHGTLVSWLARAVFYALVLTAINLWVTPIPTIDAESAALMLLPAVGLVYCVRCCIALIRSEEARQRPAA